MLRKPHARVFALAGFALCALSARPAHAQWDVSTPKSATKRFADPQGRFTFDIPEAWQVETKADATVFRWTGAAATLFSRSGPTQPSELLRDAIDRAKVVSTDFAEAFRSESPIATRPATSLVFTAIGPKGEKTRGRIVAISGPTEGLSILVTTPPQDFDSVDAQLNLTLATLTFGADKSTAFVTLPERTRVKLGILEGLSSNHSKKGEEVRYEVLDDVLGSNKEVLIAKGAIALGTVTRASRRGIFGKSGKLEISADFVRAVDGTRVPLRANEDMSKSGRSNTTGMAAATLLVAPIAIFINGRDATIKKGTEFAVFVNADTMIDVAKATVPGAG
ncbi:MAG TPA: hypothetical protein VGM51_02805 [Armatimonadota bacterium]|jgi:hypothetical protein